MKRKRPTPTVTVFACSASITIDNRYPVSWAWTSRQATVDEAHALIQAPRVVVNADCVGCPAWAAGETVETGWFVAAIGLIEDEAHAAVEAALESLLDELDAGNYRRGAHPLRVARNPLESSIERELRAYREQVLRRLMIEPG